MAMNTLLENKLGKAINEASDREIMRHCSSS